MRFLHAQTSVRRAWLRDIYSTPRSLHFSAAARAPNQESGHILGWSRGGEVFVSSWESAPTFQDRCPAGPQPDLLSAGSETDHGQKEQLPVCRANVLILGSITRPLEIIMTNSLHLVYYNFIFYTVILVNISEMHIKFIFSGKHTIDFGKQNNNKLH